MSKHDEFVEYRDDTEVVAHRISQCYKPKLIKCNLKIGYEIFTWSEMHKEKHNNDISRFRQITAEGQREVYKEKKADLAVIRVGFWG